MGARPERLPKTVTGPSGRRSSLQAGSGEPEKKPEPGPVSYTQVVVLRFDLCYDGAMDIRTATPTEIDTKLSDLLFRKAGVDAKIEAAQTSLLRLRTKDSWESKYMADRIDALAALLPELLAESADLGEETVPLNTEYVRRGRWTRAYLVQNSNGHVHNTTSCSTCFASTSFAWLTEFSGHDETEVVEAAGEMACTVCFPSAPVNVLQRRSTIELPAKRAARLEREAKSAAKAATTAVKGITSPDGSKLRVAGWTIKTEVSAQNLLTELVFNPLAYGYRQRPADVALLTEALAAKRGQTIEEVTATTRLKVHAKMKREGVTAR